MKHVGLLKRMLSLVLALILVFGCAGENAAVYAAETGAAEEAEEETSEDAAEETASDTEAVTLLAEEETETYVPDADGLSDNDTLFAAYVEQVLYGESQVSALSDYGLSYFADDETTLAVYYTLKEAVQTIAAEGGSTQVVVYSGSTENTDTYETADEYKAAAKELANELASDYKSRYSDLMDVLIKDCPYEMYWFDKTTGISVGTAISYSYYSSSAGYYGYATVTVTYRFAVSSDYLSTDSSYEYTDSSGNVTMYGVDTDKASAASTAASTAASVVSQYASYTDYAKLEAYRDYICEAVSYNEDAASDDYTDGYGDPWQLIYVFDGDDDTNVVCEGYAKAFQYLCDLTTFNDTTLVSYLVSGTMSGGTGAGGHMWNLVSVNGESYLVDITNSDEGTVGQDGGLFMVGNESGSVSEGYTFTLGSANQEISYVYDEDEVTLYGEDLLTLSTSDYDVSAETDLSNAQVTAEDQTYTGEALEPEVTVTLNGKTLTEGTDYTVSYSDNTDCGTATVTVTGTGNYTGTATGSFGIVKEFLTDAVITLAESSYTYDGTAKEPQITSVTLETEEGETLSLTEGTDYTVSYSDNVDVGTGTVTITGTGDYGGTASAAFTIEAASIADAVITLSETSFTYDGTAKEPEITSVVLNDTALSAGTDYTASIGDNTNAGTVYITLTGTGNYTGTAQTSFTIAQQSLSTSNVTLSFTSKTYTGSVFSPSVTVKDAAGEILDSGTDYTLTTPSGRKNAGTYTYKVTGKGNYTGTVSKTLTISKQALSSSRITLSYTTKVYTGSALKPTVTVKNSSGSKLTKGTDYTVTYSNNKSCGTATVTIKAASNGNYSGTVKKTFKITPKKGTIKSVKSSAKKKATVKWTKFSGTVTKYQIRYRVKGTSSWKTVTVSASSTSKTLTSLKSGKTYQVQIRAYKTISSKKYYGSWSATKTVKVK